MALSPGVEIQHPDFRVLEAVKANPSPEEIATLGVIDAFLGPVVSPYEIKEAPQGLTIGQMVGYYMCRIPKFEEENPVLISSRPRPAIDVTPPSTEPFCCPPEPDIPLPWVVAVPGPSVTVGYNAWPRPYNPHVTFWAIWLGQPLSTDWNSIPNMIAIERVLETYSFPLPFNRDYSFILVEHILPALRAFARIPTAPAVLDETIIRMFLTLTVLEKFAPMTQALQNYLEEQADNAKRRQIVNAIGIAAVGALVGAALAAAAVSSTVSTMATKGLSQISSMYSKEQQAKMAQDIAAASDAFKAEDPAFAEEVKFTSDALKFITEESGKLSQLSPEEQARIAGAGSGPGALAIAGVGAAALVALYLAGAFD